MTKKTLTTIDTVTNGQLQKLRAEGITFNDPDQVDLCDKALAGDDRAKDLCVWVIQHNEQKGYSYEVGQA